MVAFSESLEMFCFPVMESSFCFANVEFIIKCDHFDILASGKPDFHCKIKETLLIQELKPSLNVNVSSEKLLLY